MPIAQDDPVRAKLIEVRSAQIIDAAARVFAERGFSRATTREVAEAAGVSEGTIYNYFASKEDLLLGIMARLTESTHFDEALDRSLPDDPRDLLVALLRYRYAFNQQHGAMIKTILSEIMVNPSLAEGYRESVYGPLLATVERHVQARIDAGHLRPVEPALLTLFLSALFLGLAFLFILGDVQERARWDALVEFLADVVFDGLAVQKGPQGR